MDWTRTDNLISPLRRVHALREKYRDLCSDASAGTIIPLETANRAITGYIRQQPETTTGLAVLGNSDMHQAHPLTLPHPSATTDLLTDAPSPPAFSPVKWWHTPFNPPSTAHKPNCRLSCCASHAITDGVGC